MASWRRPKIRRPRAMIASIAAMLLTGGCLAKVDKAKFGQATDHLFGQIAAKQYAAVYDEAAPEYRTHISRDISIGFMQRIDRRLGACQTPVKTAIWRVRSTTRGYFWTQGYRATCANGSLALRVTMVLRNGEVRLAGYFANSPLLLTD
jgi:hypothetical protein